jgi:hypothetical protein
MRRLTSVALASSAGPDTIAVAPSFDAGEGTAEEFRQVVSCGTVVDRNGRAVEGYVPYSVGAGVYSIASSVYDTLCGDVFWAKTSAHETRKGLVRNAARSYIELVQAEIGRLTRWVAILSTHGTHASDGWLEQMYLLAHIDDDVSRAQKGFAEKSMVSNSANASNLCTDTHITGLLEEHYEQRLRALLRAVENVINNIQDGISGDKTHSLLDIMEHCARDVSDLATMQLSLPDLKAEPLRRVPFVIAQAFALRAALDAELLRRETSHHKRPMPDALSTTDDPSANFCIKKICRMVDLIEAEVRTITKAKGTGLRRARRNITLHILAIDLAPTLSRYAIVKNVLSAQSKRDIPVLTVSSFRGDQAKSRNDALAVDLGLPGHGDRLAWSDGLGTIRWLFDTKSPGWVPGGRAATVPIESHEARQWHMSFLEVNEEQYKLLDHFAVPVAHLVMRIGGGSADIRSMPERRKVVDALKAVSLPSFAKTIEAKLCAEFGEFLVQRGGPYEMGDHYYFCGDYRHAAEWYQRAANESAVNEAPSSNRLTQTLACAKLSRIHDLVLGVSTSLKIKQHWQRRYLTGTAVLRDAVAVGADAEIMFYLGRLLLSEYGISRSGKKDEQKNCAQEGFLLITRAAQQG